MSSRPSSPTGAALATASERVPAPAVPPASSAAAGGNGNVSKTTDVGISAVSTAAASPAASAPAPRPGVCPRQNAKKELMESAHLLCSLFGGAGGGGSGSNFPSRAAASAASEKAESEAAVPPPPTTLIRHGSKGPLKKRMMMPVFDEDDDSAEESAAAAKEEDGPTSIKTAVVAAVAMQRQHQHHQPQKEPSTTRTVSSSTSAFTTGTTGTPTGDYCTVLYTPGEDEIYLSPQLCLTRAQIEAFEAQPADVSSRRSAGGRSISRTLTVGQVGLRCIHCKHLTLRDRSMSAVHYPGSIRLVYQSVRNFQRNHFLQCKAMPQSIKDEFQTTRSRFVQSKGRSHVYWAKSCAEKGMVDTVDGGIRFNVDADGAVVPANPDSAVEATEAFMAQNASRGPAARKRKADRDASSGGEDESTNSGSKETTTTTKKKNHNNKKKRASKKTVAAAAAAAVAARGTAGTAAEKTEITTTTEVGVAAKPAAATTDGTDAKLSAETTVEKEDSPNAPAALAQPYAAHAAAVAPGPPPTALVAATSLGAIPNNIGGGVAPPAPALTAQVSLDAEQLLRRQMQEYQQLQQFSSQRGQMATHHQGQESALAEADRMIRASLLEQEQQRQLLAAQLSGQYHPQHLHQQALANNPAASPTLAAASAPAGAAAAPSAASLLCQQQQISATASASPSPGATVNAAARAEYLVYLETLDRMSASINAAQNLEAAYRTNPTVVGRLQYLAANDEMAAIMHRAKIQAMNLQRIRLEGRLSDLNASLGAVMQGGAPAPALAAAGAGVPPNAGAGALQLSPDSLLRQVSE